MREGKFLKRGRKTRETEGHTKPKENVLARGRLASPWEGDAPVGNGEGNSLKVPGIHTHGKNRKPFEPK